MNDSNTGAIRVVIVEDDELYHDYIRHILCGIEGCDTICASDAASTIAILDKLEVDCVIMDYDLGGENGIHIGQMIHRKYSDPPPIIMLSAQARDRVIIMALRGGFSDFIMKRTLTPDELISSVRRAVDRGRKEKAEKSEHVRLARLSCFDGMTGLHTGDFMKGRLREISASAARRGSGCAAIIVRPHELEGVADAFGYVIRDRALRVFASRMLGATREADICGQYGDDSFLYLIDREPTPQNILSVCERLSRELSFLVNFGQGSFTLTTKIGAAIFPDAAASADLLVEAAERALQAVQSSPFPFVIAPATHQTVDTPQPAFISGDGMTATDSNPNDFGRLIIARLNDRRGETRQRVLKRGKICLQGVESVLDCTIRDLSNKGARLRLVNYHLLPDRFELLVVDSGVKRPVAVRWRLGVDFGVQFLPRE